MKIILFSERIQTQTNITCVKTKYYKKRSQKKRAVEYGRQEEQGKLLQMVNKSKTEMCVYEHDLVKHNILNNGYSLIKQ